MYAIDCRKVIYTHMMIMTKNRNKQPGLISNLLLFIFAVHSTVIVWHHLLEFHIWYYLVMIQLDEVWTVITKVPIACLLVI